MNASGHAGKGPGASIRVPLLVETPSTDPRNEVEPDAVAVSRVNVVRRVSESRMLPEFDNSSTIAVVVDLYVCGSAAGTIVHERPEVVLGATPGSAAPDSGAGAGSEEDTAWAHPTQRKTTKTSEILCNIIKIKPSVSFGEKQ